MSRNKIFRCAYFSMYFRIKFLLFNDFPSYKRSSADQTNELFKACSEIPQFGQRYCAIELEKRHNTVTVTQCHMPGSQYW